jgi:hypothetical protein
MKKYLLGVMALAILAALSTRNAALAQYQSVIQPVSQPGYVDQYAPLSLFVGASLQPACKELTEGKLAEAAKAFALATAKDPDDDGAYVGLLQARGQFNWAERVKLEETAVKTQSPHDQFRFGVYSLYMIGLYNPGIGYQGQDIERLVPDAQWGLKSDFNRTHTYLAGFLLALSYTFDASFVERDPPICENIMHHLCGDTIYAQYIHAKNDNWVGALPAAPELSQDDLQILHHAVSMLYSMSGARTSGITHGGPPPQLPPYTREQVAAMSYLSAWMDAIKKKQVTS